MVTQELGGNELKMPFRGQYPFSSIQVRFSIIFTPAPASTRDTSKTWKYSKMNAFRLCLWYSFQSSGIKWLKKNELRNALVLALKAFLYGTQDSCRFHLKMAAVYYVLGLFFTTPRVWRLLKTKKKKKNWPFFVREKLLKVHWKYLFYFLPLHPSHLTLKLFTILEFKLKFPSFSFPLHLFCRS